MARILVADDDPDILTILSMSLEAVGHEVHRATNGVEAVSPRDPPTLISS